MSGIEMRWSKFYISRFVTHMKEHDNKTVGIWIRMWCYLAHNEWEKEASLEVWSKIVEEDIRGTKEFMNKAMASIPGVIVTVSLGEGKQPIYRVTDEWYKREYSKRSSASIRQERYRKSALVQSRLDNMNKILRAYHPKRRTCQVATAKKELQKILKEDSRNEKTSQTKINKETEKTNQIINYIKEFSKNKEWDEDGQHVPGIGKFLQARGWEYLPSDEGNLKGNSKTVPQSNLEKKLLQKIGDL